VTLLHVDVCIAVGHGATLSACRPQCQTSNGGQ
jgi:hypothetical protein